MSNPHLHFVVVYVESVEASNIKSHLHFVVILYIYTYVEEVETSIKCHLHFVAPPDLTKNKL